ncbi:hypothetical protein CRYUN_Cryun24cG0125400 [Craigia yunnanensis]
MVFSLCSKDKGGESIVRKEAEAVWDWRGFATKEGSNPGSLSSPKRLGFRGRRGSSSGGLRVGCLVASIVQENGDPILHCLGKSTLRSGNFPFLIVHKKSASVLCLATVKNEDKLEFSRILEAIKANFNDNFDEYRKKWGGCIMGSKSQARTKAKEKVLANEAA